MESAIAISKKTRGKSNLIGALDILLGLRGILNIDATLREALAAGRWVDAVLAYAEAHGRLDEYQALVVAAPVRDSMAGLLWEVVQKVEGALAAVVSRFEPGPYRPVFEAYVLLGEEVKPLGDKMQAREISTIIVVLSRAPLLSRASLALLRCPSRAHRCLRADVATKRKKC